MWMTLAIAAMLYSVGLVVFRRFEGETPLALRLRKLVVFFGLTGLLSFWLGNWALIWVFGLLTVGCVVHYAWCVHNQINPLTAEPKERYYQLRGWSQ